MDLFGDILAFVVGLFEPVAHLPYSAPFVALVSVLLALISTWATRRFTNVEQMNTDMAEVKEWQAELSEARRTMDPVLLQKVSEKQGRIMTIQGRMMSARMKPMCIFYIPFIIIFGILNAVYGASPVAVLRSIHRMRWDSSTDGLAHQPGFQAGSDCTSGLVLPGESQYRKLRQKIRWYRILVLALPNPFSRWTSLHGIAR